LSEAPDPLPGHDGGSWAPVRSETVACWPQGHFAENLAIDSAGDVYVSLHSHHRIDRFHPRSRQVENFARLDAPAAGLAFDAIGRLWVTGGTVGESPGYVWCIPPSGRPQLWVEVPDALFMNGCAVHPDGQTLLVCESLTGRILAIDQDTQRWSVWLEDDQLRPKSAQMPGANGIKLHAGWAWISVTDHDRIMRVRIAADGSAGCLETVATQLRADDFAFADSGALYIATHAAQTVVRLGADGTRTTLAGPREGAVGSTACAFGRLAEDLACLYVTTTGGLLSPYQGQVQEAKLLRLSVGEHGGHLLHGS